MTLRESAHAGGIGLVMNEFSVAGTRVVVMGAARSGLAAARLLAGRGALVTLTDLLLGTIGGRDAGLYVVAQVIGGCLGAVVVNLMFELPAVELSTKDRSSPALWLSEVVATVTLLVLIQGCVRTGRARVIPFAVAAWIAGAYWFTSSTSFANPAVTIARMLSDTFAGIEPASAPMFIVMQLVGCVIAYGLVRFFYPHPETTDD